MKREYWFWVLGFVFLLLPFTASAYQIDQQQTLANHQFDAETYAPTGQSFVPQQPYLLGVTLKLSDAGGFGIGNWVKIQLREQSIDGAIVAISQERYLEDCFNFIADPGCGLGGGNPAEITFLFAVPVELEVGATYVMELRVDPAGDGIMVAHHTSDVYSSGGYYKLGMPYAEDLWFRTLAPDTPQILVSTGNQLKRYDLQGKLVSSEAIPQNSSKEDARDLVWHVQHGIWVFNGTFQPELSHNQEGIWSAQTFDGWSIPNNGSYGGIAVLGDFVYVTDGATAGQGAAKGIVRFDATGQSPQRFLDQYEYIDITLGLDSKLYALRNTYGALDVINPADMTLLSSVSLGHTSSSRAVVANAAGEIFMASWNGYLYHYSPSGQLLDSLYLDKDLCDIDIHPQQGLLVSNRVGQVWLVDFELQIQANFSVGNQGVFVAFAEPSSASLDYCVTAGSNTFYEWIESVSFNGSPIVSGDNQGYFKHENTGAKVYLDQPNTLLLTPGFRYGTYYEHWAAWADFNGDGQFSDDEQIIATVSDAPVLTTFDVPPETRAGPLTIRVAMRFDAPPSSCGIFTDGEVEDFVVTVE